MVKRSTAALKGLVRYSSAPVSSVCSLSPVDVRAVSATTGMWHTASSARMAAIIALPSMPGIMMSVTTMSGMYSRIMARPSRPLAAS